MGIAPTCVRERSTARNGLPLIVFTSASGKQLIVDAEAPASDCRMARKLSINEQPPAPAMTNKNFGFFCCCAKPRFVAKSDASPDAPPAAQIERLFINCRLLSLMD